MQVNNKGPDETREEDRGETRQDKTGRDGDDNKQNIWENVRKMCNELHAGCSQEYSSSPSYDKNV